MAMTVGDINVVYRVIDEFSATTAKFSKEIEKTTAATALSDEAAKKLNADLEKEAAAFRHVGTEGHQNLTRLAAEAAAAAEAVKRLVAGFQGKDIITQAENMAAAVKEVGGASRLTAQEQARVNATVQEAINKYKALGDTVPPELQKLAHETKKVDDATVGAGASIQKMILGWAAGLLTFAAAKHAITSVVEFLTSSVDAYAEAEAAQKRLTVALQIQGQASPVVIAQYKGIAEGLAATTTVSRDAAIAMEALLVQIGQVGPEDMQRASQAVADLSAGLGIDLEAATRMVSRALEGNFMSLKRVGIQIDATAFAARGAVVVMEAIESRVGGQAQAELETYAGKIKHMANQWHETKEAIGGFIVSSPLAIAAMREMQEAVGANKTAVEAAATSWGAWLSAIGAYRVGEFVTGLEGMADRLNRVAQETRMLAGAAKLLQASGMDSMFNYLKGGPTTFAFPDAARTTDPMAGLKEQMKMERDVADMLTSSLGTLTDAQDRLVRSLLAGGIAFTDFPQSLRVTQEQVDRVEKSMKAGQDAAKKHAEELKKVAAALEMLSGQKLIEDTDAQVEAYLMLQEQGLQPTAEALWKLNAEMVKAAAVAVANGFVIRDAWNEVTLASRTMGGTMVQAMEPAIDQGAMIEEVMGLLESRLLATGQAFDEATTAMREMADLMPDVVDDTDRINAALDKVAREKAAAMRKTLGVVSDALDGLSRVAEMSGHKTVAAVASIASTTIKAFAQGGPVAGAIAFITSVFAAFGDAIFKTAGKKVNDLRDAFIAAQGGFAALNEKARQAGVTLSGLLNTSSVTAYTAAEKALTEALDLQKQKLEDIVDLNKQIAEAQKDVAAAQAATIPPWQTISGIMEKYGIDIEKAGAAAQQMMVSASATDLLNEWQQWAAAGLDLSVFAKGAAASFSTLVQQATAFGSVLPENMRGTIQTLIDSGLLLDKAGKKITDLAGVTFGPVLETEQEKLVAAFDKLTLVLQDLTTQLAVLSGSPPVVLAATRAAAGYQPKTFLPLDEERGGSFAGGTGGLIDFGPVSRVALHGREAVLTEPQYQQAAAIVSSGVQLAQRAEAVLPRASILAAAHAVPPAVVTAPPTIAPGALRPTGQPSRSGGSGTINITVHNTIQAWDGQSVDAWLRAGGARKMTNSLKLLTGS